MLDIPLAHRKDAIVSVHLHDYKQPDDTLKKVLDIGFWIVKPDGAKTKVKGIRLPLENADQLAVRLLRLHRRWCKEEEKEVEFAQVSKIDWDT